MIDYAAPINVGFYLAPVRKGIMALPVGCAKVIDVELALSSNLLLKAVSEGSTLEGARSAAKEEIGGE